MFYGCGRGGATADLRMARGDLRDLRLACLTSISIFRRHTATMAAWPAVCGWYFGSHRYGS